MQPCQACSICFLVPHRKSWITPAVGYMKAWEKESSQDKIVLFSCQSLEDLCEYQPQKLALVQEALSLESLQCPLCGREGA